MMPRHPSESNPNPSRATKNLADACCRMPSLAERSEGPSRNIHTGRPVAPAIHAEPSMPSPASPTASSSSTTPRTWAPACKRITSPKHLQAFLTSDTARSFKAFILSLNQAVSGMRSSDPCPQSPATQLLEQALEQLSELVDQVPPVQQSLRYGNPAFRTWFDR